MGGGGGALHNWYGDRKQRTTLQFKRPTVSDKHPTTKPVAMFTYLINNSCPHQGIVLDTFVGSGTSLIAAEQSERVCFAMEIDPKYCEVVIQRWEALTGQVAELSQP